MVHLTPSDPLSRVIEASLDESGITLRQAADRTGIARTTLTRRLVKGGYTISELEALADLLGTSVVSLIKRAERGEAA